MTAPNGSIVFNNSTGSDTQASGLGPANAVYGTGASTTGASAVVTGIDTTGVTAGDLLWVESSSGRQFSIIASVDSSTQVTCDYNFDNTESGRTWAIGGKRNSIDDVSSRLILTTDNINYEWTVELENTGIDYTVTSSIILKAITVNGDSTNPTVISSNFNGYLFGSQGTSALNDLHLKCTSATKTSASAINHSHHNGTFVVSKIIFDATDNWNKAFGFTASAAGGFVANDCKIYNTITAVADYRGNIYFFERCIIKDNQGTGIQTSAADAYIYSCIFINNSGSCVEQTGNPTATWCIQDSIFYNNNIAIDMRTYTNAAAYGQISRNIFSSNAAAVHNITSEQAFTRYYNNGFYNNTTDYLFNYGYRYGDVFLTADPFVNAANGDFNINTSNGGGAALRSTSYDLGG